MKVCLTLKKQNGKLEFNYKNTATKKCTGDYCSLGIAIFQVYSNSL